MSNIFEVGKPIYEIAMKHNFLPYVNQEIAAKGWSDNTVITPEISKLLNERQEANAKMIHEHGST